MGDVAQILGVNSSKSREDEKNDIHVREKRRDFAGRTHVSAVPKRHLQMKQLIRQNSGLRAKWFDKNVFVAVKGILKRIFMYVYVHRIRHEFKNSARNDDLALKHWVKESTGKDDHYEYPFARFNVNCKVTECSVDEYEQILKAHRDPLMVPWLQEENTLLFTLCKQLDLRWIIIADRYNSQKDPKHRERSVEDIKYWYYEATRLLAEACAKANAEASSQAKDISAATNNSQPSHTETPSSVVVKPHINEHPQQQIFSNNPAHQEISPKNSYRFNIEYEKKRKSQLDIVFNRSIEEETEMKKLQDQLKALENQLKKVAVRIDLKKKKVYMHNASSSFKYLTIYLL